jgi:uncharacterized spore protein YtfJ
VDVERLLSRLGDELSVGRAFGPAIERDGTLIIPVAWVAGGGGGGAGEGGPNGPEDSGSGSGSGGGFGGVTWPLGVYVVKDGKARWVPAVDVTRIVLAGLAVFRTVAKLRAIRHRNS